MKHVLWLCLVLAGVATGFSQQKNAAVAAAPAGASPCSAAEAAQAVQQLVSRWQEGYNGGDAAKVAALYTEDAYYLTQHYVTGIVQGRARIQAYVQRGIDAGYHIDALHILSVDCSGQMLYAITRYDANNAGQKVFGVNLVVAKRDTNGWRIVAHEAAVPDPATAVRDLDLSRAR